eukprot:NODE_276_length_10970_cov_0.627909.p6 type:complete len:255 gc:universal NODE_276_length_10970_cov_0.627909:9521-8757(-)
MFDSFKSLTLILIMVYLSSIPNSVETPKIKKQALKIFNKCIAKKQIGFMMTWSPSIKTTDLLTVFQLKNKKATLMVNPNNLNELNKAIISNAFSQNQIVGIEVPLWPEDLAAMSANDFATYLGQYADKISVAMNFAGQWPKYIRIPNISKSNCLIDISPMVKIANDMGFVVIQNTKGNGDIQKLSDVDVMAQSLEDGNGYIFSIEDSETNAVDVGVVSQAIASAEAKGYSVTQINNCVGLAGESSLKSSNYIII